MTNHTPGPWSIQATIYRTQPQIVNEHGSFVADTDLANARLIAAAPDMLAALEALEVAALVAQARPQELAQARAAIAKAKGETQ